MLRLRSVLLCAVATLVVCSSAFAGDRFFYHHKGHAYFCVQPPAYQAGCFRVCEDESVIKIGEYPTITTARAEKLCGTDRFVAQPEIPVAPQEIMAQPVPTPADAMEPGPSASDVPAPSTPPAAPVASSECCGGGEEPSTDNCLPLHLTNVCRCYGPATPGPPLPPSHYQGTLKVEVKNGQGFYIAIGKIQGNIKVPQICVSRDESYSFTTRLLTYNCAASLAASDNQHVKDCGFAAPCDPNCAITVCVLKSKDLKCSAECILCPRTGDLTIAIRREQVNGAYVADVLIGTYGKPHFPEYPTTMVLAKAKTQSELNQMLDPKNEIADIDFDAIRSGSQVTDLATVID